jgi:MGT family glycosyltransferase
MSHFGVVCPPSPGHLYPMIALAHALRRRGHRITFFNLADAERTVRDAGLDFHPLAADELPAGAMAELFEQLGRLSGWAGLRYTREWFTRGAGLFFRDAPAAMVNTETEALLVDQASPFGGTVADHLGLPFVTVCNALLLNEEPGVPPFCFGWRYADSAWARLRNRLGYALLHRVKAPLDRLVREQRRAWDLPPQHGLDASLSTLAQISQQPAEFEYPRRGLPACFQFAGPFHDTASREPVEFPYDRLDGRPLIYASLGTVQNRLLPTFRAIAESCSGLDAQLVISLGGGGSAEELGELPGDPVVVPFAPQLDLLRRAALTVTHAGMNTALETLRQGVPMVALPITNDQPGVAARVAWTGTGEVVPASRLTVPRLRQAVEQVLTEPGYRERAEAMRTAMARYGGADQAADLIERVVRTGQAVA